MDFEEITMELTSSLAKSDYAQVIFDGTAEVYTTGCDVTCNYTVTPLLSPEKKDWVGLYKVGWRSAKDYVHFVWAPDVEKSDNERHQTITFRASDMPSDDGEFYQFCYVTSSALVRGASTPFQFKNSPADEFVEVEEEDGELLVVRTKSAVLQEKLNEAAERLSSLQKELEHVGTERDGLLSKLVELQKQLAKETSEKQSMGVHINEYQERLTTMTNEAKEMQFVHDNLHEKIIVLNQEKECMEKRLDDNDQYLRSLQDKIKALINEKDALTGMSKALEEEKELFKGHFTSSESTIKCYLQESERLKDQLKEAQQQCGQLRSQIDQITNDLTDEKAKNQILTTSLAACKDQIEALEEKVRNAEDKLKAAEHCKILLNDEVLSVQEVYKKVADDLEGSKSEIFNLKSQLATKEAGLLELDSEIHRLKHTVHDLQGAKSLVEDEMTKIKADRNEMEERKKSEECGPLFALQVAYNKLLERQNKATEKNESLMKQNEILVRKQCAWEEKQHMMESEIRDLKNRLQMGQEEYKMQFIKSQKLQSQLSRLSRQGSVSFSERSTDNPKDDFVEVRVVTTEQSTEYDAFESVRDSCTLTDCAVVGSKAIQTEVKDAMNIVELEHEISAQLTSPTSVEDEAQTDVKVANNIPSSVKSELYQQIEEMKNELESHMSSRQKYKEEKSKNRALQEQIKQLTDQLNATEEASKLRIEKLEKKVKDAENGSRSPHPSSPSIVSAPPAIFANPYANYTPSAPQVEEFDPLTTDSALLTNPLQPLPPPMTPEMTPEAKVAAIKAKQDAENAAETEAEEDHDENEFEDAQGEPQKICPICSMSFPAEATDVEVTDHIDDHYGPVCPICHHQFEKGESQEIFQIHVENHFD